MARNAKLLTLLSHMRHRHRGDNRALLSELSDIAARLPQADRERIIHQLVMELEALAEG